MSLPDDLVITANGSKLYDLEWDFRGEDKSLCVLSWDIEISANNLIIGRLGDPGFDKLRRPLQEMIAARWKYRRPEDGASWQFRRAFRAAFAARRFAVWAAASGIVSVAEITEPVFQAWLNDTEVTNEGTERRHLGRIELADPVLMLWRTRDRISATIGFVPHSSKTGDWVRQGPPEEPIPLMPKAVLDHIVGSAIRYVDVYAHDILEARSYLRALSERWSATYGKPIPTLKTNRSEFFIHSKWIRERFGSDSEKALRNMGSRAPWNATGHCVPDPDTEEPWIDGIQNRQHLEKLENVLRTAAYIVIAFMTGGRSSEMNRLKTDCVRPATQTGLISERHLIAGQVSKHRGRQPEEVTWSVPEEAVRAAGVLLRLLASWRDKTGSNHLLVTQLGTPLSDGIMNVDLKMFLDRTGAPYVGGKPFPVSTHMLRVALAQWLAQEPYGEIAGAIHLKQLSTAAFRGYLREDPQFQSLFEAFSTQAQADHLEVVMREPVVSGRQGAQIMKARTPEQQAALEAEVRSLNYAQAGHEVCPRTMAKLKKSQRPVYKTPFTMCFFKADVAVCLKDRPSGDRTRPATHRCEPLTCANSAITRLQIPAYLEDYEECRDLAADPSQSPSQISLYREQMDELERLILPFLPTLAAEQRLLEGQLTGADPHEADTIALQARYDEVKRLFERIKAAELKQKLSS
jgi:integrase